MRDAVKAAVAAQENEIKNVDPVQNQVWFPSLHTMLLKL
jgi:hypothetical protein